MTEKTLIKNIAFAEAHTLVDLVAYAEGTVVSRTLAQTSAVTLTVFAFDRGEGISAHSAPGDALVQVLDGEARITIGGKDVVAKAGEVVVMPANVSHALYATNRFKMLLTLVKPATRQAE